MTRLTISGLAKMAALAGLLAPSPARAAVKAADSAADPAYATEIDGAWKGVDPSVGENPAGNDNGGFGFLPWSFAGGYHFPEFSAYGTLDHFIDGVDFPASTFNNLGSPAFGLANALPDPGVTYETATATRPFVEPLEVGDVFSVDFDTPAVYDDPYFDRYPFAIITFNDANGEETFGASAGFSGLYGDFNWTYTDLTHPGGAGNPPARDIGDAAGVAPLAPTATSDGSSISLEVTSETTGHVTFDGLEFDVDFKLGLPASISFTLFANSSGDGATETTGEREFFFDNLMIETAETAIPGDFDGNGTVAAADLLQWRGDFGVNGDSDADGDTDSDGNDLLIWQRNLGLPGAAAAVPEPASTVIAGAALAVLNASRIRRARQS